MRPTDHTYSMPAHGPQRAETLPLLDAIAARDEAMQQVADKAERLAPSFTERAAEFVLAYLERGPASGEAITLACRAAGIVPHDDRAFGPVYMRLSRRGLIAKAGECARARGHGTAGGNIWQLGGAA